MAGLTFFLAAVVSLQVAQDGVHSCTLRSHYKAEGTHQLACSTPGAADPILAIPRRTPPVSCATPALRLPYYPDALNKIPSISPVSFKPSQPKPYYPAAVAPPPVTSPPVAGPQYLTPVSADISRDDRILIDFLIKYIATAPGPLPLPPLSSSFRGSAPAKLQPALFVTPTPYYPAVTPNPPQISQADLQQQFLSFLMSVSGPGSDLANPAVPSGVPSLPVVVRVTEPPPTVVATNVIEAAAAAAAAAAATPATEATAAAAATPATEATASAAPVNDPKSTLSAPVAPPSSLPTSDPAGGVPAAVQTPDPVPALAPIVVASDSAFVEPKVPGSALGPAAIPAADPAPAADPVSTSTPDVASSVTPLSQPPPDATVPANTV